jgi:DNA-binding MarR family transcriptional regulator
MRFSFFAPVLPTFWMLAMAFLWCVTNIRARFLVCRIDTLTHLNDASIYPNMGIYTQNVNSAETLRLKNALWAVQSQLSLQQLVALLIIRIEPGLSVNDLADRMDIPQQSASRHVAVLTGRYQNEGDQPADVFVVQQISPSDPRSRSLHLTLAGEAIVASLIGYSGANPERVINVRS